MKIKTLKKTATCNQRKHLSYFNWECPTGEGWLTKLHGDILVEYVIEE